MQLRPRLQSLAADTVQVAQDAQALLSEGIAERTLGLSTRFSPLAGAQLANFGGFLDRPLREFDYYAGIYDGVHAAAVFACREQDPAETDASGAGAASQQLGAGHDPGRRPSAASARRWARSVRCSASRGRRRRPRSSPRSPGPSSPPRSGAAPGPRRSLATPEWSWLGPPKDPRALGSLGIVSYVLLSQK